MPQSQPVKFYVYMVRCSDGTYYTGYTHNLKARVGLHNTGKGAKYTRSRRPVRLIFHEIFASQAEAMKREIVIKTYSKDQKRDLVRNFRKKRRELKTRG